MTKQQRTGYINNNVIENKICTMQVNNNVGDDAHTKNRNVNDGRLRKDYGDSAHAQSVLCTGVENGFTKKKDGAQTFGERIVQLTNTFILPVVIISFFPTCIMALVYANTKCSGSYVTMVSRFQNGSISFIIVELWGHLGKVGYSTIAVLVGYYMWAILCTRFLPGNTVKGPLTQMGNTPVYVDNGMLCYSLTMAIFVLLTILLKLYDQTPTVVLDNFAGIAAYMNIYSVILVFFLYLKGIHAPSSTDSGQTGKGFIFDYYWGTELYPRVLGVDIKILTNCRFAMTAWPILVCLCALKSYELHGFVDSILVATILQLFYVTKFFYWESGYYGTMDIVQDRAGFYIIWGCLSLVPPLYPIASFYLVNHPVQLGPFWTSVILIIGILSTMINYLADLQKHTVRQTNGNCVIWGMRPDIIRAKFQTESGQTGESILLASGWWGISRHFHYIPEIILAVSWTVTTGFENVLPYTYILFLAVLLVHRSFRDDRKCSKKYGKYWKQYCRRVKYRIVPYLF